MTVTCADAKTRRAAIEAAIKNPAYSGMPRKILEQLYSLGVFRHDYDVQYAAILYGNGWTIEAIIGDIDSSYENTMHTCERVQP